ncbi:MAG: MFS transporter [Nitrospirae bacterium]|nr:MFS transporter [Nitrospirota bacterium]
MNDVMKKNMRMFTANSSVFAVVTGIVGPYITVLLASKGFVEMGIAMAIMMVSQALTTFFSGYISDRLFGGTRKPFLIAAGVLQAVIFVFYPHATTTVHFYALQFVLGMVGGILTTIRVALLSDLLPIRKSRGQAVGTYNFFLTCASAVGLVVGSIVVKYYGYSMLFTTSAVAILLSSFFLLQMDENYIKQEV